MIILDAHTIELCDVNPPGQSGFISPSGEYSPHYDDQMQLYKEFGCKTVAWDKEKIVR